MKFIFATLAALLMIFVVFQQTEAKNTACLCPRNMDPVCGTDGETYANPCLLRCEADSEVGRKIGLKVAHHGECNNNFI